MNSFNFLYTPSRAHRIAESRGRLFRVAYAWCHDEMLADDLVQETLTAGITNSHQLRDDKKLFPWLYSILHNNWQKHLRNRRPQDELDDELPCDGPCPLCNCEGLELIERVRRAMATLPCDQRQVITLIDLEELSYSEVSEALKIPIGTVMSRLHRARRKLMTRLDMPETLPSVPRKNLQLIK